MICRILKHAPMEMRNRTTGATVIKCSRCGLDQNDWAVRTSSATMDGFRRGLWQAGVAAGGAFAYQLGIADAGMRAVIAATLVAFFLALTGRTVEGKMDERRNSAVVE